MGGIKSKHTQEKQTAQNNQIQDRNQSKRKGTIKQANHKQVMWETQQDRQTLTQIKEKTDRQYPDDNIRNDKGDRKTNTKERIMTELLCYFKCKYFTKLKI